jgi:hypothetical protein
MRAMRMRVDFTRLPPPSLADAAVIQVGVEAEHSVGFSVHVGVELLSIASPPKILRDDA